MVSACFALAHSYDIHMQMPFLAPLIASCLWAIVTLSLDCHTLQVDLSCFNAEQLMSEPVFADQINLADVLVGSKADLVQQAVVDEFLAFAEELFPPKAQVMGTAGGIVLFG